MATLAIKGNGDDHDIQKVEVLVRGVVTEAKVTTILHLLLPMINNASAFDETLYKVKEGDRIKNLFKFEASENLSQAKKGSKEMEGEVSVVCVHEHPFLDRKVWLATKARMESTYLKRKVDVL
jgi:hypothetical protein